MHYYTYSRFGIYLICWVVLYTHPPTYLPTHSPSLSLTHTHTLSLSLSLTHSQTSAGAPRSRQRPASIVAFNKHIKRVPALINDLLQSYLFINIK